MSDMRSTVDFTSDEMPSLEALRLSYQIDEVHRQSPVDGNRIVDFNGEKLGTSTGVTTADRYRSALVSAKFDGGVRALCAAGQSCSTDAKCGFCPYGVLRPVPADGHEHYPSAVVQAQRLWNVRLDELFVDEVSSFKQTIVSSLGAMLLAAHVQGHNCLSSAFEGIFSRNVPHEINTLSGVTSWAKAMGYRADSNVTVGRKLMVARVKDLRSDTPAVTHVFPVCGFRSGSSPERLVEVSGYSVAVSVMEYERALYSNAVAVCVDVAYPHVIQNECIQHACRIMPTGYKFCEHCGFTVKSEGHADRCRPAGKMITMEMLRARAQFGDLYHTQDVLHALIDRKVPGSERTIRLAEYQSGAAQAAFMRFAGYEGSDSVLSTWFEAAYDYFRSYYWEVTFECDPPFPILLISDLHPERLDPRPLADYAVAPDYRVAWAHVLRVSSPVGKRFLDDPVKAAVSAARRGEFTGKVHYNSRYTKLPPPTRFAIKPVSGSVVYQNSAFLEVCRSAERGS